MRDGVGLMSVIFKDKSGEDLNPQWRRIDQSGIEYPAFPFLLHQFRSDDPQGHQSVKNVCKFYFCSTDLAEAGKEEGLQHEPDNQGTYEVLVVPRAPLTWWVLLIHFDVYSD